MLKNPIFAALVSLVMCSTVARADETPEFTPPLRRYELVFAPAFDLRTVSAASPTLHRMTSDVYLYGIRPHLSPLVDAILGTVWSAFFTYTTMLWPHEFGHWSRAHQVDSKFVFQNFMPLLPRTTVEMPADASKADSALLSVGGFEVNGLVAREAQLDFYRNGAAYSDELSHALLNELFFPIYAGIFPAKAKEPVTWTETRGDPVHFVLPVYERATERPPVTSDGTVDRELIRQYREAVLLSIAWTALDPGLLQQVLAFADRGFDMRKAWMPVRTKNFGWTWGTQFNPSPLGYELYLLQYLSLKDHIFEVAVKFGRPMKNNGLRIAAPNLFESSRLRLGLELEGWDQDVYGLGGAATAEAEVQVVGGLGVVGWLGYKSDGYVMGRAIDETLFGAIGLSFAFEHGLKESEPR